MKLKGWIVMIPIYSMIFAWMIGLKIARNRKGKLHVRCVGKILITKRLRKCNIKEK